MKKTLLSAAAFAVVAVSAVSIAPTTSEAIPAFARQTGAACLSCHFQTFPAVNSFGRAFKMGAFTDVGEEALIEDDNLSLPAVLNSTFVLRAQYSNQSVTNGASTTTWNIPADAVLLMAGRVGSNTGAFIEFVGGTPAIGGGNNGGAANWQLMNSFDFDSFKGGVNIQNTGFGPTAAIEISNVYGQHGGKLNGKALSAVNNIIGAGNSIGAGQTTSVAGWIGNESFLVQAAGVAMVDATTVSNASFVPMLTGHYIMDMGAAELMIGGGILAGEQRAAGALASGQGVDAKWIDFQVQGEMGDMSYGVYGDWATSKAKSTNALVASNFLAGGGNQDLDGYSLRVEVEPVHQLMVGFGVGQAKLTNNGLAGESKVTSTQIAVTYEVYQNMEINTYFKSDRTTDTGVFAAPSTTTKTLFAEVEALF